MIVKAELMETDSEITICVDVEKMLLMRRMRLLMLSTRDSCSILSRYSHASVDDTAPIWCQLTITERKRKYLPILTSISAYVADLHPYETSCHIFSSQNFLPRSFYLIIAVINFKCLESLLVMYRLLKFQSPRVSQDPLRTRAIPERLRGVFTTRRYTNTRLPLPFTFTFIIVWGFVFFFKFNILCHVHTYLFMISICLLWSRLVWNLCHCEHVCWPDYFSESWRK